MSFDQLRKLRLSERRLSLRIMELVTLSEHRLLLLLAHYFLESKHLLDVFHGCIMLVQLLFLLIRNCYLGLAIDNYLSRLAVI